MRTRLAYFMLVLTAASAGYWYAGQTGAGPDLSRAQGAGSAANTASNTTTSSAPSFLPANVSEDNTPTSLVAGERNNIDIYQKASPAVVNITTRTLEMDFFFRTIPREGSGSGFLVDQEGHIVTNNHVVADARQIQVTLSDRSTYEAEIIGVDPLTDLAVIRIKPGSKRLPALTLGDSDPLQVGQKVLAIGNPFGLQGTLTTGVISAVNRTIYTGDNSLLDEAIQTDAAINPGNSGGPLLDSQGRVIGVNTMIIDPTRAGGSVGVGFAVPVNTVKFVLNDLIEYGRVRRGSLGIRGYEIGMISGLANALNLPVEQGVLIRDIEGGGPADKAGLRESDRVAIVGRYRFPVGGDIITTVDGQEVKSPQDINRMLYLKRPGERVTVEYYRNNKKRSVKITLEERRARRRF